MAKNSDYETIAKALQRNGTIRAASYGDARRRLGLVHAMGTDTLRACLGNMSRLGQVNLAVAPTGQITVKLPS